MNVSRIITIALLAGGLAMGAPAQASDAIVGAVVGAGAGALLGQAFGGRDGAIVGGMIGAAAGASATHGRSGHPYQRHPQYHRPPAQVYYHHYRPRPPVGYYPTYRTYSPPPTIIIHERSRHYRPHRHGHGHHHGQRRGNRGGHHYYQR